VFNVSHKRCEVVSELDGESRIETGKSNIGHTYTCRERIATTGLDRRADRLGIQFMQNINVNIGLARGRMSDPNSLNEDRQSAGCAEPGTR
jgi:hypothetical protein